MPLPAIGLGILASAEIEAAAVALMGLYIKYGPTIMAALSETPFPSGVGIRQVVHNAADGGATLVPGGKIGLQIYDDVVKSTIAAENASVTLASRGASHTWAKENVKLLKNTERLNQVMRIVISSQTKAQLEQHIRFAKTGRYGPLPPDLIKN